MLQQTEIADRWLENAGPPTAVIQEVLPKQANSWKRAKSQYNVLPLNAVSITPTSEPETVMFHKYYKFPGLLFCGMVREGKRAGQVYGLLQVSALAGANSFLVCFSRSNYALLRHNLQFKE